MIYKSDINVTDFIFGNSNNNIKSKTKPFIATASFSFIIFFAPHTHQRQTTTIPNLTPRFEPFFHNALPLNASSENKQFPVNSFIVFISIAT